MGMSLSSTEITEIEIIVRQLYDERNISTSVDSLYEQNKRFTSKRIKKKIVVCDEAWIFLKYKESGDFLANVARRGRKFNVSLLIGSQFMDEFLNCDERKSNNKYMCNSFLV